MSAPVPSPSMNGMIGWSGTCSLPFAIVIFSPPAGMSNLTAFGIEVAPLRTLENGWES